MHAADQTTDWEPGYIALHRGGELAKRVRAAWRQLQVCDLCARYCRVNRLRSVKGAVCRTGEKAVVHSYGPHHGEERPLRGWGGSGTIFFSWCNLRCVFCQNWDISQKGLGEEVDTDALADIMLRLQRQGCHNINFVSPSHVVAQILAAVDRAAARGLRLPLVYNTGGYDSPEALELLDGVIDIYLPDVKFADSATARTYTTARDYAEVNQRAVRIMHRQVGDLVLDEHGLARRGLLIRHLVLPDRQAGTDALMAFIARELSPDTCVNVMGQYHPCYRADNYPALRRPLTRAEHQAALESARRHGLHRLDA